MIKKFVGVINVVNQSKLLSCDDDTVEFIVQYAKQVKTDYGGNVIVYLTILENKSLCSIPYYSIYKQSIL